MNLILFWKTLTEISLYFCFAHFVGALAGASGNLLRSALILALAGAVGAAIDRKGHPKLRFLGLILIVPAFLLCEKLLDALLLVIPALYVILMVQRHAGDTSYYEFQRQFKMGVRLLCVVGVLLLMAWQHPVVADFVLPYILIYLVGGVLALRLMRHSDDMLGSRQLWLHNILSLLPVAVAGLLISSPAAGRAALATLRFIFNKLVYPIIALFSYIMTWLTYVLFSMLSQIELGESEGMKEIQEMAQENTERILEQGEINTLPTEVIMGFFLLVIFGALLFMMLRFLRKSGEQRQNAIHEVRSRIEDVASNPRQNLFDRSPRSRVRATYRKFINLCVGAGAKIHRTDTTEDIDRLAHYALENPPQTRDLQQIYRKARYSEQEITDADADAARAAYQAAKSHYKKINHA